MENYISRHQFLKTFLRRHYCLNISPAFVAVQMKEQRLICLNYKEPPDLNRRVKTIKLALSMQICLFRCRVAKRRYPGIQDTGQFWRKIRTFSNSCYNSFDTCPKQDTKMIIYDTVHLKKTINKQKTSINLLLCQILLKNSPNA